MIEWYMYGAINGAEVLSILIGIPKRLEIAVNHRKQNTEVVSNRDTKRGDLFYEGGQVDALSFSGAAVAGFD